MFFCEDIFYYYYFFFDISTNIYIISHSGEALVAQQKQCYGGFHPSLGDLGDLLPVLAKFSFWTGVEHWGIVQLSLGIFLIFSDFCSKYKSLKSFGNSCGNSYIPVYY